MAAYLLPVVSVGGAATVPSRVEGWWLASAAAAIAVLALSSATVSGLPAAAGELAAALASRLRAAAGGEAAESEVMRAADERLRDVWAEAPYCATGPATADQAPASLVLLLDWGATQVGDAFDRHVDPSRADATDRELVLAAAGLFADAHALLTGRPAFPDFAALEGARLRSADHLRELIGRADEPDARSAAARAPPPRRRGPPRHRVQLPCSGDARGAGF